jgi:hypothetical protein
MSKLLNIYEGMQKRAEQEAIEEARLETIYKYASVAEELLEQAYGDNYSAQDVEKLAAMLISNDVEAEEEVEKVAEYDELGRIMARSFLSELYNN